MAGRYEIYGIRFEDVSVNNRKWLAGDAESLSERARKQGRAKNGQFAANGSLSGSSVTASKQPALLLLKNLQPYTEYFDALLNEEQTSVAKEGLPQSVLHEIRQKYTLQGKTEQELENSVDAEVAQRLANKARRKAARAYFLQHLQGKCMEAKLPDGTNIYVAFTGTSWQHIKADIGNDPVKASLIPHIPDIIDSGKCSGPVNHKAEGHGSIRDFYSFRKVVETSEGPKMAIVDVANHQEGLEPEHFAYGITREGGQGYAKRFQAEQKAIEKKQATLASPGSNLGPKQPVVDEKLTNAGKTVKHFFQNNAMSRKFNLLTFDSPPSRRSRDENGFLHVTASHITKAVVNPYYGREIPGWEEHGLEPDRVYYGYRDPDELAASVDSWSGLPLHIEHHVDSADEPARLSRVGAVGAAVWNAPYIDAQLTVWDGAAIRAIEDGSFRELSCAYRYDPDFTPGSANGVEYDFVMRNIRGNHVALVEEGRAGHDVVVADSKPVTNGGPVADRFRGAKDADPINQAEEAMVDALVEIHQANEAAQAANDEPNTGDSMEDLEKKELPAAEVEQAPIEEPVQDDDPIDAIIAQVPGLNEEQIAALRAALEEAAGKEPAVDECTEPVQDDGEGDLAEPEVQAEDDDEEAEKQDEIPAPAMDAALRKVQARTIAHIKGLYAAAEYVKPLVGSVNAMSFDSAGSIYAHALKRRGINVKGKSAEYCRGMVAALRTQQKARPMAQDSAVSDELDTPFQHVKNIILN